LNIKEKIKTSLPAWRERVSKLVNENGSFKIADLTVEQIYSGIRGVPIQVSDISFVDPKEGIRLRGYTVPEVLKLLPKPARCEIPFVGGLYYLLMTGEIPSQEEAQEVEVEWKVRNNLPDKIYTSDDPFFTGNSGIAN
jgi:citrate synthase